MFGELRIRDFRDFSALVQKLSLFSSPIASHRQQGMFHHGTRLWELDPLHCHGLSEGLRGVRWWQGPCEGPCCARGSPRCAGELWVCVVGLNGWAVNPEEQPGRGIRQTPCSGVPFPWRNRASCVLFHCGSGRLKENPSFAPCFAVNSQLAASWFVLVHFMDFLARVAPKKHISAAKRLPHPPAMWCCVRVWLVAQS